MDEYQEQQDRHAIYLENVLKDWRAIKGNFAYFTDYFEGHMQQELQTALILMEDAKPGSDEDRNARMKAKACRLNIGFFNEIQVLESNVEKAEEHADNMAADVDLNNIR